MNKKLVIEDLLTVDVEGIKDFQTCERLYDYRHLQKEYEPIYGRDLLAMRFENTLKKVVTFFFYKKQAGSVPSYSALLNRWEKLWFNKDTTAYDIAVEQHESFYKNQASYSTDAAAALLNFYEDFTNDPSIPLLIGESFTVPLRRNIHLTGEFDLVLRTKDQYRVIKWSSKVKRPSPGSMILDFAALKVAFDYRNEGKTLNVQYGLYDLASTHPGFNIADVNPEDIAALNYWANEAWTEVHGRKVFASRRGLIQYCKGCPFDKPCSTWKAWPEVCD